MTNRTYTFNGNKVEVNNQILHQIIALRDIPEHNVKVGDHGGYIWGERALGFDCWINDKSTIEDVAVVKNGSLLMNSKVVDGAVVDKSSLFDSWIYDKVSIKHTTTSKANIFGSCNIENSSIAVASIMPGKY